MRFRDSDNQPGFLCWVGLELKPGVVESDAILTFSSMYAHDISELNLSAAYGPYIDGRFRPIAGETFPALDAATGEHLAEIANCGTKEIDIAVTAAQKALVEWRKTTPEDRAALLLALADRIERDSERLSLVDTLDIGRRLTEIRIDYAIAVAQYRYFAAAAVTHEGFGRPIADGYLIAKREPIGVCGQIIPWNVPAIMVAFKLAPALAAGNTVVLKPDENASLSTLELAKHIEKVFPPGVVNIVPGCGETAGAALSKHPGTTKLAFTGSSEVGRLVAHAGAERLVPVSLELGGKSPNIVFPDIENRDAVVDNALFAAMYCNGQSCLAGTRLFLHEDIYDDIIDRLIAKAEQIKVRLPLDPVADLSGLISAKQGRRVMDYIDIASNEGADLLFGGRPAVVPGAEPGRFVQPTLFAVTNTMTIAQDEVFGPVLSIIKWNNYERLIEEANAVKYGLAAGIYTTSLRNAMDTADRLEAGSVWINNYFNLAPGSPFGGYKESGLGREYCHETLNMYSQLKSITVQTTTVSPRYLAK